MAGSLLFTSIQTHSDIQTGRPPASRLPGCPRGHGDSIYRDPRPFRGGMPEALDRAGQSQRRGLPSAHARMSLYSPCCSCKKSRGGGTSARMAAGLETVDALPMRLPFGVNRAHPRLAWPDVRLPFRVNLNVDQRLSAPALLTISGATRARLRFQGAIRSPWIMVDIHIIPPYHSLLSHQFLLSSQVGHGPA